MSFIYNFKLNFNSNKNPNRVKMIDNELDNPVIKLNFNNWINYSEI